jgi:hypothetical protein
MTTPVMGREEALSNARGTVYVQREIYPAFVAYLTERFGQVDRVHNDIWAIDGEPRQVGRLVDSNTLAIFRGGLFGKPALINIAEVCARYAAKRPQRKTVFTRRSFIGPGRLSMLMDKFAETSGIILSPGEKSALMAYKSTAQREGTMSIAEVFNQRGEILQKIATQDVSDPIIERMLAYEDIGDAKMCPRVVRPKATDLPPLRIPTYHHLKPWAPKLGLEAGLAMTVKVGKKVLSDEEKLSWLLESHVFTRADIDSIHKAIDYAAANPVASEYLDYVPEDEEAKTLQRMAAKFKKVRNMVGQGTRRIRDSTPAWKNRRSLKQDKANGGETMVFDKIVVEETERNTRPAPQPKQLSAEERKEFLTRFGLEDKDVVKESGNFMIAVRTVPVQITQGPGQVASREWRLTCFNKAFPITEVKESDFPGLPRKVAAVVASETAGQEGISTDKDGVSSLVVIVDGKYTVRITKAWSGPQTGQA